MVLVINIKGLHHVFRLLPSSAGFIQKASRQWEPCSVYCVNSLLVLILLSACFQSEWALNAMLRIWNKESRSFVQTLGWIFLLSIDVVWSEKPTETLFQLGVEPKSVVYETCWDTAHSLLKNLDIMGPLQIILMINRKHNLIFGVWSYVYDFMCLRVLYYLFLALKGKVNSI